MGATDNILSLNNFDLLNTFIACVAIFATVYISNRRMRKELKTESDIKLDKKADLSYVKERNAEFEKKFIATDASIETMNAANSSQHKDLFNKIEEVGKGVARIEGYLSAKKEKTDK